MNRWIDGIQAFGPWQASVELVYSVKEERFGINMWAGREMWRGLGEDGGMVEELDDGGMRLIPTYLLTFA